MKIAFGLWFDFIFYFVLNFLLIISKLFFLNKLLTVKKNFEILCILFRRHALFTRFDIDKNAYSSHDSEVFHWFWIWLQPICIIYGWFLFSVSNKVLYKFIVFLFVVFFFWHWSNVICKAVREDFLLTPAVMKGFRLWQCLVIYTTTVEL